MESPQQHVQAADEAKENGEERKKNPTSSDYTAGPSSRIQRFLHAWPFRNFVLFSTLTVTLSCTDSWDAIECDVDKYYCVGV